MLDFVVCYILQVSTLHWIFVSWPAYVGAPCFMHRVCSKVSSEIRTHALL